MRNWQADLRALPKDEREEYTQGLNNVIEATSAFHLCQEQAGVDAYHTVDQSLDHALFVPLLKYEQLKAYPLQSAIGMRLSLWSILPPVLGFVRDLGFVNVQTVGAQGIGLPKLKRWRRMRLLDRSTDILMSVAGLKDVVDLLAEVRAWHHIHKATLKSQHEACLVETRLLRKTQEREAQESLLTNLRMDIGIEAIPHTLFRTTYHSKAEHLR